MVQIQCVKNYGWAMEVYVKGTEGRGYLDLFDSANREYYEVKSHFVANSRRTKKQMSKYNCAIVQDTFGNRNKINEEYIGADIEPGKTVVGGYFQYGIYDIDYNSVEDGLIEYNISLNAERALALGISAAAIALLAAAAGVVASTVVAPTFA